MSEHTPTPWRLDMDNDGEGSYLTGISGPDDQIIVRFDDDYGPSMGPNMRFIVRAVNAFEPMREALRAVEWVVVIPALGAGSGRWCPSCREWDADGHAPDCRLAAAIAKAEKVPA